MKTLSLCMIVRDEEKNLDECLRCCQEFCDEIVIVDTGSKDKTKIIAQKYTENVYDFEWVDDFSRARNYSFDKATKEYIMWLDGDDFLTRDTIEEIIKWKNSGEDCDVLMCRYVAGYKKDLTPTFEYYRERIVKNTPQLRWKDAVHEVIVPVGKVITNSKIAVYHNKREKKYSDRNLNIYLKLLADGVKLSPRGQFYYARELYFLGKTQEAIHEFSKFLADDKGWSENKIEACLNLAKCYEIVGQYSNAMSSLYGSFSYDDPRGEIIYEIGNVFMIEGKYDRAIFWLKLALTLSPNLQSGGFINQDCYNFLPALQLCVCYDKLGDYLEAYKYHLIAEKFYPEDKSVLQNKKYFDAILKNKNI